MGWPTSNINLATYIEEVKGIRHTRHRYKGRQLLIEFDITADEARKYEEEYLTSPFAGYDATKRTFIQLLKLAPG
jgi:hypothetical protein